jgi:YD repeat-containing protein
LSTIDPLNHSTSQTYDNAGNVETKKDGLSNTTTYTYDEFNRLANVKNAKNENTSYTFDLNGNKLTQTDGKGNITTFEYNAANKLIRKIDHSGRTGTAPSYTYDLSKTESYTYYPDGSLHTKTDRNGETTTNTYDIHGKLISEAVGTSTISYTYDNNGNQLTMTDGTGTTTRTYDELGRVKTKDVPGIGTTTYIYDMTTGVDTGCVAENTTDPKGNVTTKIYDRVGRLASVTAAGKTTSYTYNDNGARQSVVYSSGAREDYRCSMYSSSRSCG